MPYAPKNTGLSAGFGGRHTECACYIKKKNHNVEPSMDAAQGWL